MSKIIRLFFLLLILVFSANFVNNSQVKAIDETQIYDGNLGVIYSPSVSEFRLISSKADEVTLIIKTGEKAGRYLMSKVANLDLFSVFINGDLKLQEYVYEVVVDDVIYENVLDPYSKAISSNMESSIVINFSDTSPENWYNIKYLNISEKERIIYGLHVEDFTSDPSWNGSDLNRGKFFGLIEEGTSIQNKSTGFDHITSLGVNYIELMPVYDSGLTNYGTGYAPLNPFSIAQRYSSMDNLNSPINEFKKVVMIFNLQKIGVIMKVDFTRFTEQFCNNIAILEDNFLNQDCHLNLDNLLAQKYLLDLYSYYTQEFMISGFNIMNLSDYPVSFMQKLISELKKINPNIYLYGDGNIEGSNTSSSQLANLEGFSVINSSLGDGLFGSFENNEDFGLLTGDYSQENIEEVKFALLASINNGQIDYSKLVNIINKSQWATSSTSQLINTLNGYSGLTLYDKLQLFDSSLSETRQRQKIELAYLTLFLSGGSPYIYSGEEFMKSRIVIDQGEYENIICEGSRCFSKDPSENNDYINWQYRVNYFNLVDFVKSLINIRNFNQYDLNRPLEDLKNNVEFLNTSNGQIGYLYDTKTITIRKIEKVMVLFNYSDETNIQEIPQADKWESSYRFNSFAQEQIINLQTNSYYIAYSIKQPPFSTGISLLILLGILALVYFINLFIASKIIERKGKIDTKGKNKYLFLLKNNANNKEKKTN